MEKKNLLKLSGVVTMMTACTIIAGVGVWAAAQDTLTATDKVSFVADPWVDAKVSDGTNHFLFSSTDTTDDKQTGTFVNINNWTAVEGSIKQTATFVLTITNTSTVDTNELVYAVTNDWAVEEEKCTVTIVDSDTDSTLAKGESATIAYTFTADGRYDFEQDIKWTISLSASNKRA